MKKLAILAVVTAMSGCASDSENTEIITSSQEEIYLQEQVESETLAKLEEDTISSSESVDQATVADVIKKAAEEDKASGLQLSKASYSIQVLALSHNKGFVSYMNKLPSDQPVWTNTKQLNGVPWYTLLYGNFDTKEQARKALEALPRDVKEYGPFIRDLAEVKASPTPKLTRLN
ncbi:SPOR domain-containing protein [Photobacterium sp. DNB23_23_1]|uniref:SPOR domain-containing protein n=1 Tax=Photobacterium pectinilyticum TaxID=2906793 RepID=A0ABT1MWT6_9GAMM|nr:SPOR domain-containing protein [Photobacterium sp. ZSDE20]MCQ1056938.1 SPOR domain-containing protein [Photobacterium sp. ZSDE20]MDD1821073.1 SPOR domain-containing protein [Photobacterium sp. ZSDE20]